MWYPRVKISIQDSIKNEFYEVNKWTYIRKFNTKNLFYRYKNDNNIEFIIDGYKNKKDALKNGKILFYNVLIKGYYSFNHFNMGDDSYITKMYHKENGYSQKEFYENEEWFYNTKNNSSDFLGLSIYEADSIEDLESYKSIKVEICSVLKENLDIIKKLQDIDYNCTYTKILQRIFNMFKLVESADPNTKILLLCQILEIMGTNAERSEEVKNTINKMKKMVDSEPISIEDKESLKGGLEGLKHESSKQKIKRLLKKYCNNDNYDFDIYQLVNDCYGLRSSIIHGNIIEEKNDLYIKEWELKRIVLDTFYNWSKENQ